MNMPRPRPPHLHRQTTRHGKTVWYVRFGKGPRTRVHAEYGTPEFDVEYEDAVVGKPRTARQASSESLQWLCDKYRRESPDWAALSLATRRQRENIFKHIMRVSGHLPAKSINRVSLESGRDSRKPHQGRHFIDAMRGLFRWAYEKKHLTRDPSLGVAYPDLPKTRGFEEWTDADVALYEAHWPAGTRQRVWLDVLLYTGGRRGDVHHIGKQHIKTVTTVDPSTGFETTARAISFRTEKNDTEVTIPYLDALADTVERGPCGDLTFCVSAHGEPYSRKESFGNAFSDAAKAAGVRKSAHGVRKAAATRCAERGATVHDLNAIFGWTGTKQAMHYTESADRKRMGMMAGKKLDRTPAEHSIPSPDGKVRAAERKMK